MTKHNTHTMTAREKIPASRIIIVLPDALQADLQRVANLKTMGNKSELIRQYLMAGLKGAGK